ncbi:MAG: sigma-70 family RNA polymerase sigma factor [Phycisphaeraceae bacterium]|nr:sigma-70 family RNA polymerase sigma factor [Phycisphaerales bacterium]MCB9860944.1 sigma-70 family RNA polymerase sigma factor [Phycisphaeraceae bacterium]
MDEPVAPANVHASPRRVDVALSRTDETDEQTSLPTEHAFDPAIVAQAAAGNEQAWAKLVDEFGRRLYALAKSRLRSAELAEEITQSVFATVAQRLRSGSYAELGKFEPWLFRIAVNRIRDEVRRTSRHASPTDPVAFSGVSSREGHAPADPHDLSQLRDAIAQLPETDQQIIMLRHHAQMSFQDMADTLEQPLGTLLARHHRALKKLRTIIESMNEQD